MRRAMRRRVFLESRLRAPGPKHAPRPPRPPAQRVALGPHSPPLRVGRPPASPPAPPAPRRPGAARRSARRRRAARPRGGRRRGGRAWKERGMEGRERRLRSVLRVLRGRRRRGGGGGPRAGNDRQRRRRRKKRENGLRPDKLTRSSAACSMPGAPLPLSRLSSTLSRRTRLPKARPTTSTPMSHPPAATGEPGGAPGGAGPHHPTPAQAVDFFTLLTRLKVCAGVQQGESGL